MACNEVASMWLRSSGWRMKRPASQRESQRGMVLLSVLWIIMLLALIAANATTNSRTSLGLARNHLISAQAEAVADAGVHVAILSLLDPEGLGIFPEDGTPFDIPVGGTVVLSVQDEAGLLNLNYATVEELARLMTTVGMSSAEGEILANAIVSFRKSGSGQPAATALTASGTRGPAGPKNRFFDVVEELQQVEGITPTLFLRLSPYVTVDSRPSRLDPNTAPDEVVYAVTGLMRAELEQVLAANSRSAGDAPFGNRTLVARDLVAPSEREIFVIRAEAITPSGGRFVRIARIYCSRDPELPYQILGWTMGRPYLPFPNR
jgi:general secretion pathway protein K